MHPFMFPQTVNENGCIWGNIAELARGGQKATRQGRTDNQQISRR